VSTAIAILEGTVRPDGTLELHQKVNLPPGKVQVTLVARPDLPQDDPFWQLLGDIWAGQKARGHIPRTAEDVEAERRAVRDDWEERMAQISRIQQEAEQLRLGGRPQ
jgi:hypothetical protein